MNAENLETKATPLLVVLSGPSGAGKDAVVGRLKSQGVALHCAVTATTRAPRPGEKDGVNYHFVSAGRFREMIEKGELLEWASVYGNLYGVPREGIRQALARGQDVLVKVDVQGAATIKRNLPEAVFIFLASPLTELERRLKERATESAVDMKARISAAPLELESLDLFDYLVTNYEGKIDQAVSQIAAIFTAEKCRVRPRTVTL